MRPLLFVWTVVLVIINVVHGTTGRYMYPCSSSYECDHNLGLICNKQLFGGCSQGVCFCGSGRVWDDEGRKCKTVKRPNDECDRDTDLCTGQSKCRRGVCQCDEGKSPSPGLLRCINNNFKILGDSCVEEDVCYHYSESSYVPGQAECRAGECRCKSGFSRDRLACRPKRVGEGGCQPGRCITGAQCDHRSQKCVCPAGKISVRGGEACVPQRSTYDLALGEKCEKNTLKGRLVCHHAFECSECPGSQESTCIKFGNKEVPSTEGGGPFDSEFVSASSQISPLILWLQFLISLTILFFM